MPRNRRRFATLLALSIAAGFSAFASFTHAHEVRPAYLEITETAPGEHTILWKQPVMQDRMLPLQPILPAGCEAVAEPTPEYTGSALIHRWKARCNLMAGNVHIKGLSATLTDVMVRINPLNREAISALLRPENPTLDLSDPSPPAFAYLTLGVEHLLFGIDHVLFVIGLVLFIPNRWQLLKTITAFTMAHSITLALSVLDLVRVEQAPVEAIIALSILFLARELLLPAEQRSRLTLLRPWVMALIFGLLHGLGFAGALRDIGLPEDQLWLALLLFNVGIELGQLLIIAATIALLAIFTRLASGFTAPTIGAAQTTAAGINVSHIAAWGMGCIAAYWTIDRIVALVLR